MNLEELKAQNAAEEAKANQTPQEDEQVTETVADEEATETDESVAADESGADVDKSQDDETVSEGDTESEPEAWMNESTDEQGVPIQKHIGMKQRLKGKIEAQSDELSAQQGEIDSLKAKLAQYESGTPAPTKPVSEPVSDLEIPMEHDFDTPEEYRAAMVKYQNDFFDRRMQAREKTSEASGRKQKFEADLAEGTDAHYQRAEELINQHSIDPELYKTADRNVRIAVEQALPNRGEMITDFLISSMGEGSEKVMYFIGRNEAQRNKLQSLLREDPNGIKASIWLGTVLADKASAKSKSISQAPAPAARVKGGDKSASGEALQRKYKDAHKKRNVQEAYNIKKQAKKQGVDVTNW
jgi:hypothetical protein